MMCTFGNSQHGYWYWQYHYMHVLSINVHFSEA